MRLLAAAAPQKAWGDGSLALSRGQAIALLEIPALTHNDFEAC
jgi:hypothetical protein